MFNIIIFLFVINFYNIYILHKLLEFYHMEYLLADPY